MAGVIFARPRHDYVPYHDLYRLISLSGYPLLYIDEIDPERADVTYVLTILNGEWWPAGWPGARARIVLYDLEWHIDGVLDVPGLREVWAADAWYARRIGARYVPLGSHPDLPLSPRSGNAPPMYDIAMLAYLSPRRQPVVSALSEAGLRLAPNGTGMQRDALLYASRAMLHVGQLEGVPSVAPQRFAIAAAYGLPLLSETVAEVGIFADGPVIWLPYDHLPQAVTWWLAHDRLAGYGTALREWLCERYSFRKCIEEAL